MAKITNSFVRNRVGGGYEKTITTDSGNSYTVRNTFVPNRVGGGYEQEIVPSSSDYEDNILDMIIETPCIFFALVKMLIGIVSIFVGVVSVLMNWMDGWKCVPLWWSTGISAVVFIIWYVILFSKK